MQKSASINHAVQARDSVLFDLSRMNGEIQAGKNVFASPAFITPDEEE
jgi:hypothetical protein